MSPAQMLPNIIFLQYILQIQKKDQIAKMIEEIKYCSDAIKEHFNKELSMTKKMMKIFRTLLNFGPMTMIMLMKMLK